MRVQGNINPKPVIVSDYRAKPGTSEVRIRANVAKVADNLYEYDEYTTLLPSRQDLEDSITANLEDWLITLRTLEANQNASIVADQRRDIDAYEQALSEIETALGVI